MFLTMLIDELLIFRKFECLVLETISYNANFWLIVLISSFNFMLLYSNQYDMDLLFLLQTVKNLWINLTQNIVNMPEFQKHYRQIRNFERKIRIIETNVKLFLY